MNEIDQVITESAHEISEPESIIRPMEAKSTEAGQQAADKALLDIRGRSYSGRHPELGKMIKCPTCGRRHRETEVHEQRQIFAKRWTVDNDGNKVYTQEELIAGQTPETETVIEAKKIRLITGAPIRHNFSKPRRHPHLNRKSLIFVQLVREYTPNEYSQEDLDKARKRARKELGMNKKKTWGYNPPKPKEQE